MIHCGIDTYQYMLRGGIVSIIALSGIRRGRVTSVNSQTLKYTVPVVLEGLHYD